MSQIRVKAKYRDTVIGFNNSGKPLGLRDDLHLLLEMAKANNVHYILDMFEEVPTDQVLLDAKTEAFIKKRTRKTQKTATGNSE
jgi:hypothetical protein